MSDDVFNAAAQLVAVSSNYDRDGALIAAALHNLADRVAAGRITLHGVSMEGDLRIGCTSIKLAIHLTEEQREEEI